MLEAMGVFEGIGEHKFCHLRDAFGVEGIESWKRPPPQHHHAPRIRVYQ